MREIGEFSIGKFVRSSTSGSLRQVVSKGSGDSERSTHDKGLWTKERILRCIKSKEWQKIKQEKADSCLIRGTITSAVTKLATQRLVPFREESIIPMTAIQNICVKQPYWFSVGRTIHVFTNMQKSALTTRPSQSSSLVP